VPFFFKQGAKQQNELQQQTLLLLVSSVGNFLNELAAALVL